MFIILGNGFLSMRYLQQYLGHKHHTNIICYGDGDNDNVVLDGTVIWEKTNFHGHFHTTHIQSLLYGLAVNNKSIKIDCLMCCFINLFPSLLVPIKVFMTLKRHKYLYFKIIPESLENNVYNYEWFNMGAKHTNLESTF